MKVGKPKQVKAQGKLALKNTPPTKDNGMKMMQPAQDVTPPDMERINRFEMEHKEEEYKRPDISKERLQMMGMDFSDSEDEDDHHS